MRESILFYDASPEGEAMAQLMENDGYAVSFFKSPEAALQALKSNNFRCLVSEIRTDPVPLSEFLHEAHRVLDPKNCPHLVVTDWNAPDPVVLSETYGVRSVLFKPIQDDEFKKTLRFHVLNKKQGIILCPSKRQATFSKSFHSMGFAVRTFTKLFEFNMHFSQSPIDFIIYVEGFEGADAVAMLSRLNALRLTRLPIYFFLNKPNETLNKVMERLGPHRMEVGSWEWDQIESRLQELIIEYYTLAQSKEEAGGDTAGEEKAGTTRETEPPSKPPEAAPPASDKVDRGDETASGSLSFNHFMRVMPQRIGDPRLYTPLVQFFKSGTTPQRERSLEVLNGPDGARVIAVLGAAFQHGNNLLRESLIELLSEITSDKSVVPVLGRALSDKVPSVQMQALMGLRNFELKETQPLLEGRLLDPNQKVRTLAARILEHSTDLRLLAPFTNGAITSDDPAMFRSYTNYVENSFSKIKDLNVLSPIFQSSNTALQEMVLDILIQKKDARSIPFINYALASQEKILIRIGVEGAQQVPDPSSIPFLLKYMDTADSAGAEKALRVIVDQHGTSKMLQGYLQIIDQANDNLREYCLDKVKVFTEKENAPILRMALNKGGPGARLAAIEAMDRWKPDTKILSIGRLLDDPEKGVRDYVGRYIRENATTSSLEPLIRIFSIIQNEEGKKLISSVLGELAAKTDTGWLSKAINKDSFSILLRILKDTGISLGKYTSEVLGEHMMEDAVFDIIVRALYENNVDAKAEAIIALGGQGNPKAIPHLVKFLNDSDWDVRRLVIESLGKLNATQTGNLIIKKLTDENSNVRLAACQTLFQFHARYKEALLPLILKEENPRVAEQLTRLLTGFNDPKVAEYELPRLSSNYIETRIQAAANLLPLWEGLDQKQVAAWMNSKTWYLRCLSIYFWTSTHPELIRERWNQLMKDPSEKIRAVLVELVLQHPGLAPDNNLEPFLQDSHPDVRRKALEMVERHAPDEMATVIRQLLPAENDDQVWEAIIEAIDHHPDEECLNLIADRATQMNPHCRRKLRSVMQKFLPDQELPGDLN